LYFQDAFDHMFPKTLIPITMYNRKDIPLFHRLPLTRIKILIARALYRLLRLMRVSTKKRIRRRGIWYQVDLTEGIDLSLFLFGNFQRHVLANTYFSVPHKAVVFDIGANIGTMTLNFARLASEGRIFAFEPTHYAFEKLKQNISLNPELAQRIRAVQLFISDRSGPVHNIEAFSSWKIDGSAQNSHPLHGGMIRNADGVSACSLDDFCIENQTSRVDLIKIDTDGHELQVLKGADRTLGQFKPLLIFEIGLYTLNERHIGFEQYFNYLKSFGYVLINSKNGKVITLDNYLRQIPLRSTTDIMAIPAKR
jgi:FkbM family methyltransferase